MVLCVRHPHYLLRSRHSVMYQPQPVFPKGAHPRTDGQLTQLGCTATTGQLLPDLIS